MNYFACKNKVSCDRSGYHSLDCLVKTDALRNLIELLSINNIDKKYFRSCIDRDYSGAFIAWVKEKDGEQFAMCYDIKNLNPELVVKHYKEVSI